MNFNTCLEELIKQAGLLDTVKEIATTPIAGTKPWFIGRSPKPLTDSLKSGVSGVRKAVTAPSSSRRLANGAYDVSDMAKKMGLV